MANRKLGDLLKDPDRNLRKVEIPAEYLEGVEPTTFLIERTSWAELITLEQNIAEARKKDDQVLRFYSNEYGWEQFSAKLVRIESGEDTLTRDEIDLGSLPETWRRFCARQALTERDEGYTNKAELGED